MTKNHFKIRLKWFVAAAFILMLGCGSAEKIKKSDLPTTREAKPTDIVAQVKAEIIPKEGQQTSYGIPLRLENTEKFLLFYKNITLTPAQEKTKDLALAAIPAPCCPDNPMSTCCCICNLGRSVWGLSNYLIKEKKYDAKQVRQAALQWLRFIRQGYYLKEELQKRGIDLATVGLTPEEPSCYTQRCDLPFDASGCGGMW